MNNKFNSSITDIKGVEKWLINISINQTAVRNHGKGIVNGIRYELCRQFKIQVFIKALMARSDVKYMEFLDNLTNKLTNKRGRDEDGKGTDSRITWGAARKCINLLARSIVYNGFIWDQYKIKLRDFGNKGIMDRLEVPLDSYSVKGIIKDCGNLPVSDHSLKRGFTIIGLKRDQSVKYQEYAKKAAQKNHTCRVHLDMVYWRRNQYQKTSEL